jgi:hypothetical protein
MKVYTLQIDADCLAYLNLAFPSKEKAADKRSEIVKEAISYAVACCHDLGNADSSVEEVRWAWRQVERFENMTFIELELEENEDNRKSSSKLS